MNPNANAADRIVRLVIAAAAFVAAFAVGLPSVAGWVLMAVGTIMLITGILGFCPLYRLVGLSTCKVRTAAGGATTPTSASRTSAATAATAS